MNSRNILLIVAAILVPGGVLMLVPSIYRWVRQLKVFAAATP